MLLLVLSHVGDTGLQLLVCNNCCGLAASTGQRLIPGFMSLQTWNAIFLCAFLAKISKICNFIHD